jgi:hypothetical protein
MVWQVVVRLGDELDLPVIDLWTLLKGQEDPHTFRTYLADGLHLNQRYVPQLWIDRWR